VTDDELREQLALAAIGALDADERAELDALLRDRPDLRAELDELVDAAALLADAVAEEPPPSMRAGVLAAIAATPQAPRQPEQVDEPPLAPVVPLRRRRSRVLGVVGAIAAAAAVLVGVLVVAPWSATAPDQTSAVLDADDAETIEMPGTLPGVTIVHSSTRDAAVLQAADVPVPPGDRVYELWAIRNGTPERYATFRPDADGQLSVYAAGLDPASAEAWAITEEPAGGSDTPTLPILNVTG
jgi:anti-sigma-K factor RskA